MGVVNMGVVHTGVVHMGVVHMGVVYMGKVHMGVVHLGVVHLGVVHTGSSPLVQLRREHIPTHTLDSPTAGRRPLRPVPQKIQEQHIGSRGQQQKVNGGTHYRFKNQVYEGTEVYLLRWQGINV